MKKRVKFLIVEDDPNICDLIQLYIEKEGYQIVKAHHGETGIQLYYEENPDFIILDIMLPEICGWDICKEIRRDNQTVPIIMLTGKGESYDKIRGLNLGADDYIVKPFDPNELIARIKAILRRSNLLDSISDNIAISTITIDMKELKVCINGTEIMMPPKEIELLFYFATNQNQVFTRQQLLDRIWGYEYDGDPRTIDVHVKRIREKLSSHSANWYLKTIRGVGYKFEGLQGN